MMNPKTRIQEFEVYITRNTDQLGGEMLDKIYSFIEFVEDLEEAYDIQEVLVKNQKNLIGILEKRMATLERIQEISEEE